MLTICNELYSVGQGLENEYCGIRVDIKWRRLKVHEGYTVIVGWTEL